MLRSPKYLGEIDDPAKRYGCQRNPRKNAYVFNRNEAGVAESREAWSLVCHQKSEPLYCSDYTRYGKSRCNLQGGCVWVRVGASFQCLSESSDAVTCDILTRQQCRDSS